MSWQVAEQYVDKTTEGGRHYVKLVEPITGAVHDLVIYVGHDACPTCGHVWLRALDDLKKMPTGHVDAKAEIKEVLAVLEQSHSRLDEHAKANNVPVLRADGKAR